MQPEEFQRAAEAIEGAVGSVIVGQRDAVRGVLMCLVAGRHGLLEGVPGVGKTRLVRAFSDALGLRYGRIQFTPDLMPADITGTNVLSEDPTGRLELAFQPGPIFTSLLLADEVNRATPKTQSALLEAMEEGTVTIGNASRQLPQPFCVLATQNPIEMHGTYPLPEAQLDRFFLKLGFESPDSSTLADIVSRTADGSPRAVDEVADAAVLARMNALARAVPMAPHVVEYACRLVVALSPERPEAPGVVRRLVRHGPSPRGAQALCHAGQIAALLDERFSLAFRDVRHVARAALRHRVLLSFEGEREGVSADAVIDEVLAAVPEDAG